MAQAASHRPLPRRPGIARGSVHVGFVVDKGMLVQVYLQVLRFPLSIPLYHGSPHTHTHTHTHTYIYIYMYIYIYIYITWMIKVGPLQAADPTDMNYKNTFKYTALCADHMSTQYRLVQSRKTASGGCSAGQGSSEL
jgi:hypothetical protein